MALRRNMGVIAILACVLAAPPLRAAACGGHGDRDSLLVSTSWLAGHLSDRNLVVLSIGAGGSARADYDKGHIPGAQFLEYMDTHVMQSSAGLTLEMSPIADLVKVFGKVGVTND